MLLSGKMGVVSGLAILCLQLAVVAMVRAEPFDRGQALFENHCQGCHDSAVLTRKEPRARSMADIRRWVATWSFHAELDWSAEEIDDVADFLNRRYYRFTESP